MRRRKDCGPSWIRARAGVDRCYALMRGEDSLCNRWRSKGDLAAGPRPSEIGLISRSDGPIFTLYSERPAMGNMSQHYCIFETAHGFCAIAWNDAGITRFQLPTRTADAAERILRRRAAKAEPGTP